jgi:hypothetical protein
MIKICQILCVTLFFNLVPLHGTGPKQAIYIQPYQGICLFPQPEGRSIKAVTLGVAYYPFKKRSLLALTLEQQFGFSSKSYNWPELGSYKFTRNYNHTGISAGFHFLSTYRFNFTLGLKLYRFTLKGKLVTDNQLIRNYVADGYFYEKYSIDPFIRFNFRFSDRFSIYSYFHSIIESGKTMIGFGLAYNFYEK